MPDLNQEGVADNELEQLMLEMVNCLNGVFPSSHMCGDINRHDELVVGVLTDVFVGLYAVHRVKGLLDETEDELHVLFAEEKVPETDFLVLQNDLLYCALVLLQSGVRGFEGMFLRHSLRDLCHVINVIIMVVISLLTFAIIPPFIEQQISISNLGILAILTAESFLAQVLDIKLSDFFIIELKPTPILTFNIRVVMSTVCTTCVYDDTFQFVLVVLGWVFVFGVGLGFGRLLLRH